MPRSRIPLRNVRGDEARPSSHHYFHRILPNASYTNFKSLTSSATVTDVASSIESESWPLMQQSTGYRLELRFGREQLSTLRFLLQAQDREHEIPTMGAVHRFFPAGLVRRWN